MSQASANETTARAARAEEESVQATGDGRADGVGHGGGQVGQ
ncbi:hypothetical protein [Nonomuraea angiospora]|nr:hypothetical protein [Nonomuraea angiospora]MDX3103542.1 hypothetical protein [Nonomuraea angiospora]